MWLGLLMLFTLPLHQSVEARTNHGGLSLSKRQAKGKGVHAEQNVIVGGGCNTNEQPGLAGFLEPE